MAKIRSLSKFTLEKVLDENITLLHRDELKNGYEIMTTGVVYVKEAWSADDLIQAIKTKMIEMELISANKVAEYEK